MEVTFSPLKWSLKTPKRGTWKNLVKLKRISLNHHHHRLLPATASNGSDMSAMTAPTIIKYKANQGLDGPPSKSRSPESSGRYETERRRECPKAPLSRILRIRRVPRSNDQGARGCEVTAPLKTDNRTCRDNWLSLAMNPPRASAVLEDSFNLQYPTKLERKNMHRL